MSPPRSWSSATNRTGPTTVHRCRRSCCRASGSRIGSTSVSPTPSTISTSSGDSVPPRRRSTSPARELGLADGSVLGFDGLVIATGAHPRRLAGQDTFDHVHELRTLDDSLALRAEIMPGGRRVVVIGAGFIGLEAAATAKTLGNDVVVLEGATAPLIRGLGARDGRSDRRSPSRPRRRRSNAASSSRV